MKHKGNNAEYLDQRNAELLENFNRQLRDFGTDPSANLFALAASMPASRFFVGEWRALIIIRKLMRGEVTDEMTGSRRKMYKDIYDRVVAYMESNPDSDLQSAVFSVVNSPAPEFYITASSAKTIIYAMRRSRHARKALVSDPFNKSKYCNC